MMTPMPIRSAAFLVGLFVLPASASEAPLPGGADVMHATTDAPEYCKQLARRVDEAAQRQPARLATVSELIIEGKRHCAAGRIRNGVHRLRAAWVLLGGS